MIEKRIPIAPERAGLVPGQPSLPSTRQGDWRELSAAAGVLVAKERETESRLAKCSPQVGQHCESQQALPRPFQTQSLKCRSALTSADGSNASSKCKTH